MRGKQRFEYAARGAAGTDQQQPSAGDFTAVVVCQVAHQAGTVGVVTEVVAVGIQQQGVDGAGTFSPLPPPATNSATAAGKP